MDGDLLKKTWALALERGDLFPAYVYAYLWRRHPETRRLFPAGMAVQRDRLVGAIGEAVANVDDLDKAIPFLQQLGRNHLRRYGVRPEHYPMVREALMAAFEHYLETDWTDEVAGTWAAAYQTVADVMINAAERPFEEVEQ